MSEGVSFWRDGSAATDFPPLDQDLTVNVAILGGGIVGLHCALGLRDSGLNVAMLEARRVGEQATGKSTAKITSQHGLRYRELVRDLGQDAARIYATANQRMMEDICALAAGLDGTATLERRAAYVYAQEDAEADRLKDEARAAADLGLPASFVPAATLPVPVVGLLKFDGQAQFDPVAYLRGLARQLSPGLRIHEQSRVTAVDGDGPFVVRANGHQIRARIVVVATQIPVVGTGKFHAKVFPKAHPVAAAPLPGTVPLDGMFISAGRPGHSFRTTRRAGQTWLIAVGQEFTLAEPDDQARAVEDLRHFLRAHFGIDRLTHLWINEDFRSMDGTAFIGSADDDRPDLLVATGFSAWGITQGALAGEILAATTLGQPHPAAEMFDATRIRPLAAAARFVAGNLKAGTHLVADKVLGRKIRDADEIPVNGGGVIARNGEKLAVRRDQDGGLTAISAVCTHMGCIVDWNDIDRTWDCPCHGSRFDETGAVLSGPAMQPLEPRGRIAPPDGAA